MGEQSIFRQVLDFHRAAAPEIIGTTPKDPDPDAAGDAHYAFGFVKEEYHELVKAWEAADDVSGVADALADIVVVCCRMAVIWGIDLDRVINEVMMANWAKVAGGVRKNESGKILKPEGWVAPDIEAVLRSQKPLMSGGEG